MNPALSWTVYLYFGLSAAHWWHVLQLLHYPQPDLWCGNVVTDPYSLLTNYFAPVVAVCVATRVLRRIQARRRPLLPVLVLPVFFGTTAALLYEAYWLRDYGVPHPTVWWFPWL
jgi:hypothetical protein